MQQHWWTWRVIRLKGNKRKTDTVWYHFYVDSKKHNKLTIMKERQTHQYREQTRGYQ